MFSVLELGRQSLDKLEVRSVKMRSITRPPSQSKKKREAVELRVFAAVEEMLAEGASFTEIGVGAIAERAGVARSTFYVYFSDKTALLLRLASDTVADLWASARHWLEAEHETGFRETAKILEDLIARCRVNAVLINAFYGVAEYEPEIAKFKRETFDSLTRIGAERVKVAQARGEVDASLDPAQTAHIAVCSVESSIIQHILRHPPEDDASFALALSRSTWMMIYGSDPAHS